MTHFCSSLRRRRLVFCTVLSAACLDTGCQSQAPPPAAAPPAEVTVARPVSQMITESLEYTGTLAALASVEIRPRVTGFILSVEYTAPAVVAKDQLLFKIDPEPFDNRIAAKKAQRDAYQAQLIKAQSDFEKVERLYRAGSASVDEFTEAQSRRDALTANIAGVDAEIAQAQLERRWCDVTAPLRGRISRQLVDPGNIVQADTTLLANIVDDSEIYVYFNMAERDVLLLAESGREKRIAEGKAAGERPKIQDLKWPIFIGLMTEAGFPHRGEIDYVAPEIDTSTGTIQVRGVFDNQDTVLVPGLFARVQIPVSEAAPALTVTERALGSDQGQRYLYTVNEKNVVERRDVVVGVLQSGARVIKTGLGADDRVIVNGMQRVRPGLTVQPVDTAMPQAPGAATQPTTTAAQPQAPTARAGH
jgi:RND family efflux transporter MFP subunit